ncbi:MAG: hypothetical protein GXO26_07870, partial [Crenarchaeota archaeon]|nr:hypothetical protein [Thermoproteota archaeon]
MSKKRKLIPYLACKYIMNKLVLLLILLTVSTVASSCVALYLALNNGYKIVKIQGTVIPIKVV